jgi:flagellar motility protein MotE (MotC chaperone)
MRQTGHRSLARACLLGPFIALLSIEPSIAAEKGWDTTIITGAVSPRQTQAAKPATPLVPVDRIETGSVPPIETQANIPSGKPAGERSRAPASDAKAAQQYCLNIASAAADARAARQKKMLAEVEQELDKRIARLEAKTAEYQKWLARRDEFSKKAQEQLVGIFSRMRPDAAAPQLAASDEETAAAVLSKLDTRTSSAILSEMEPNQAARLMTIMVGAGKTAPDKSARAAPDGRRS